MTIRLSRRKIPLSHMQTTTTVELKRHGAAVPNPAGTEVTRPAGAAVARPLPAPAAPAQKTT